jgi:hypothetical protein
LTLITESGRNTEFEELVQTLGFQGEGSMLASLQPRRSDPFLETLQMKIQSSQEIVGQVHGDEEGNVTLEPHSFPCNGR